MAETLGSLCDKLTVIKLKQWHATDPAKLESLARQEVDMQNEINEYLEACMAGRIPVEKIVVPSNKVYKKEGNHVSTVTGTLGDVVAKLAEINCKIWHEQEKAYEFETVPAAEKNTVVKNLAIWNLERNLCIEAVDRCLYDLLVAKPAPAGPRAGDLR